MKVSRSDLSPAHCPPKNQAKQVPYRELEIKHKEERGGEACYNITHDSVRNTVEQVVQRMPCVSPTNPFGNRARPPFDVGEHMYIRVVGYIILIPCLSVHSIFTSLKETNAFC